MVGFYMEPKTRLEWIKVLWNPADWSTVSSNTVVDKLPDCWKKFKKFHKHFQGKLLFVKFNCEGFLFHKSFGAPNPCLLVRSRFLKKLKKSFRLQSHNTNNCVFRQQMNHSKESIYIYINFLVTKDLFLRNSYLFCPNLNPCPSTFLNVGLF